MAAFARVDVQGLPLRFPNYDPPIPFVKLRFGAD